MGKELQVLRSRRNSLQQYSFSVFSSSTLVEIPQKLIPFIYAELDSRLGTTAVTERRTWQNLLPALQFTLRLSHCFLRILTHVPSDIRLFQSSDQKIYSLDFFFLNSIGFQVSWKSRGWNSKQSFGFITSKMFLNIKDGILSSFISHL